MRLSRFIRAITFLTKGIYISSKSTCAISCHTKFRNTKVRLSGTSSLKIGENTIISNCVISLYNSHLTIDDNCNLSGVAIELSTGEVNIESTVQIKDYHLFVVDGSKLSIGRYSIFEKNDNFITPTIRVTDNSLLSFGDHNRIRCAVIEQRFHSICTIGRYNCINERTEIRSDKMITIGDYNMISYDCRLWDTNTHSIYWDSNHRRELTEQHFPNIGYEEEQPACIPIAIGNDNWIGERAAVLKGSIIHDKTIIGYGTTVIKQTVHSNKRCVAAQSIVI